MEKLRTYTETEREKKIDSRDRLQFLFVSLENKRVLKLLDFVFKCAKKNSRRKKIFYI